jgi:hypothetical protein
MRHLPPGFTHRKVITISEIARIPLFDGGRRPYQYVDLVNGEAALADTIVKKIQLQAPRTRTP